MRGSCKGPEPKTLRDWKNGQHSAGHTPRYDQFPNPQKGMLAHALYLEQTGQCVYCGRRVRLVKPSEVKQYHIEHFRPQKKYRSLELEYLNLFLSCGNERKSGTGSTCGAYKGNWFDENCHISPCPDTCSKRFFYRVSGKIHGDGSPEANKMIDILNLNDPELVEERR